MYEPSGGSAPSIAGKNIANPIGQIMSAAMMLQYSFGLLPECHLIEESIQEVLRQGFRTRDLASENNRNELVLGTEEFGDEVVKTMGTLKQQ